LEHGFYGLHNERWTKPLRGRKNILLPISWKGTQFYDPDNWERDISVQIVLCASGFVNAIALLRLGGEIKLSGRFANLNPEGFYLDKDSPCRDYITITCFS